MPGDPALKRLSKDQKTELLRQVQQYFRVEFEVELGDLRAELVLEFFGALVGPLHYNEAIEDARAVAAARAETIQEEIFGLTRKLELMRD